MMKFSIWMNNNPQNLENMKSANIYHYETYTAAKDNANLYYIGKPNATSIQTDTSRREISIFSRFHLLAVFSW